MEFYLIHERIMSIENNYSKDEIVRILNETWKKSQTHFYKELESHGFFEALTTFAPRFKAVFRLENNEFKRVQ